MIIAVMIFAVISTVSYSSLIRFFDQSQKIEAAHARLEQIQKLFSLLEQDIRYLVPRPVQYNNTTYAAMEVYSNRPVFTGEKMQFTTSRPTPLNKMSQTNFRVSWRFNDDAIYRYSWKELDIKDRVLGDRDPELQHIQHVASDIDWNCTMVNKTRIRSMSRRLQTILMKIFMHCPDWLKFQLKPKVAGIITVFWPSAAFHRKPRVYSNALPAT
jgi:type II secretion system protein J